MALGAVIALATPLIQNGIGALQATNQKDKERFATAQSWYQSAIQGDGIALCKLKYMGGKNGTGTCGGEVSSGFATPEAKQYCDQLYQQALRVLNGTQAPSSALPGAPSNPSTADQIGRIAGNVSNTAAQVGTIVGQTPPATTAQKLDVAKQWGTIALVLAVAGFGAYLMLRRK